MGQLEGKVAVITGSTRGLGLAIVQAYVREGASVVITSRSQAAVNEAVETLRQQGARVSGFPIDVAELTQVQALADHAVQTFGTIDIWVNNAGFGGVYGPTVLVEPQDFERVLRTNILGTYYGSITALNYFLTHGQHNKLINLLGRGDKSPTPFQIAYGSSKTWVRSFTLALAKENASNKRHVGIFALNPGLVDTDLLRKVDVVEGYESQLKNFGTIIRMWANPPAIPAEKAVWLASAATDDKMGIEIQALGFPRIVSGAIGELSRRVSRQPLPDRMPEIHIVNSR